MSRDDESREQAKRWLGAALRVEEPFPWQLDLLFRFIAGSVPGSLDIPTGLGKTAVMAIWLAARACGAAVPRRLVYVVDRRAVVDQATAVAESLRELVNDEASLKAALRIPMERQLSISTLRGQFADNREWLADPSAPAIVIGTVDMVGSRLLFQGYGLSRKVRSFHAGMLGADTLFALDEAHLVPAFERLSRTIANGAQSYGPREASLAPIVPPFQLLSLSATGKSQDDAFRLTPRDQEHPIVRRRLDAPKRMTLRPAIDPEEVSLAEALAKEAWDLCEDGTRPLRAIVFCNSRGDAQKVHEALEKQIERLKKAKAPVGEQPVALLVGERRVYEREQVTGWLKERGFIAGSKTRSPHACFLVATSAGEVGIDLDADHMVSDLVPWERMVQRLGRVNRRGDGDAWVIVVPCLPNKKERAALAEAVESRSGEERGIVTRRETVEAAKRLLEQLPRRAEGDYDASPAALVALRRHAEESTQLREEIARATTPIPLCPPLSRAVVESWSMTSLDEHTGRPDVQPWLRGWVDEEVQTQLIWRASLPVSVKGESLSSNEVEAFFEAAAPHVSEILEVESFRVLPWLKKRVESLFKKDKKLGAEEAQEEGDSANVEATGSEADDAAGDAAADSDEEREENAPQKLRKLQRSEILAFVLPRAGKPRAVNAGCLLSKDRAFRKELRDIEEELKGGTLVVLDRVGGLDQGLLSERAHEGKDIVRLGAKLPFHVGEIAVGTSAAGGSEDSGTSLDEERWRRELDLTIAADGEGEPKRLLSVWSDRAHFAATEDARSVGPAQLLEEHQSWAELQAKRIAESLELPAPYASMLALAARLHDEGKRAERWQRAFKALPGGPWGKTTSRPNQRLLDSYRHEFGSLLMVEGHPSLQCLDADLRDLCLHLIAAHHGYARPSIRTDGCEKLPPSALEEKAREVALRFARLEKRWGPWGLAWWETLLRAADQEASRLNDARGKEPRHG